MPKVRTVVSPPAAKVAALDRMAMKNTQSSVGKPPSIPNKAGGATFKPPPTVASFKLSRDRGKS